MIRTVQAERIAEGIQLRASTSRAKREGADDGLADEHQRKD
ncbi:hypothetical protein [Mesorhizobium sp. BH1-1-5]|nr:hypothetical protein [Mesorhizobium sp. BH1-1-5]